MVELRVIGQIVGFCWLRLMLPLGRMGIGEADEYMYEGIKSC